MQTDLIRKDEITYGDIPNIIFDPFKISNSSHYSEGLKHLDKDISNFSKRLDELKEKICNFNEKTKQFQKDDIYKKMSSYFVENGFKVDENDSPKSFPHDAVLIKLLTDQLKSYWYKKEDFNLGIQSTDELRINGSILIAKVSDDKKEILSHHIRCLKQYHPILKGYDVLLEEYNQIIEKSENLSREINDNVVSEINIGDYKTTCDECGWFNFLRNIRRHTNVP